jgi:hypothetical protein
MRLPWTLTLGLLLWSLVATQALADKRVALIIGNGAYAHAPHLPNPSHDAADVGAALKRTGFETIVGIDLDQNGMQDAAIRFARAAREADVALFYYSGHAMQYAGVNYLVPVDTMLRDEADLRRMMRVDEILADLQQAKNLRILVLDSCRDNPLADDLKRSIGSTRAISLGRGLAKMDSPDGTIIAYSTQAGRTAADGAGRNSPYTAAFLNHIEEKEDIATIFHRIGARVYETTSRAQTPELSLSFYGQYFLAGPVQINVNSAPPSAPADPCAPAESHWRSAEAIGNIGAFEDHLSRFPACAFAGLAKARIDGLKRVAAAPATAQPPPDSAETKALTGSWEFGRARGTTNYPAGKLCQITLSLQKGPFGNMIVACNANESYWSLEADNELVFRDSAGIVTTRFRRLGDRRWEGPFRSPPVVHYITR